MSAKEQKAKTGGLSPKQGPILLFKYVLCLCMAVVIIGPLLIILFTSFKTAGHMVTVSPLALPPLGEITLANYLEVFSSSTLLSAFANSCIILLVSLVFNVMFGSVTAYCLERFEFRCKKLVYALFFLGMMVPMFVVEIARFKVIQSMGLYNTLGAPIVIYIASDLMQLYIYRQFISKIPVSIDESALIDGCSYFRIFGRMIFPLIAPATATLVIIKSIFILNDMYIPFLYMPSNKLKTLTTFLMGYASAQQGSWQTLSAGIILVFLPTFLIYLFFSKQVLDGVAAGSVKE